nr:DUF1697 domain-containing protein [uncultured Shinella sp.]
MTEYVALLRAVNVGGTGKLPMYELKAMCVAGGFEKVQTYIASGIVVFSAANPSWKSRLRLRNVWRSMLVSWLVSSSAPRKRCRQFSTPIHFPRLPPTGRSQFFWRPHCLPIRWRH